MAAVENAIQAALGQLGVAYRWGGEQPGFGFDCSGLVQYAFGKAGVSLPRTADAQQRVTERVKTPAPGDLVFYGAPAHHVGLYLGAGKMVAAPRTGDVVKVQDVYSSTDGPTYGRVKGAGAGGVVSAVTGALGAAAGGVTGAVGSTAAGAGTAVVKAAQPVLMKVTFVGLGLSLIGYGVYTAARGGARTALGGA